MEKPSPTNVKMIQTRKEIDCITLILRIYRIVIFSELLLLELTRIPIDPECLLT